MTTTAVPCTSAWLAEISDQADSYVSHHTRAHPGNYDAVVYYMGAVSGCDAENGWSAVGGRRIWLNGTLALQTLTHEPGHHLALAHAGTETCSGGTVPLSNDCVEQEADDASSTMGRSIPYGYSSAALQQLGWNQARVATVSGDYPTTNYWLPPLEVDRPDVTQAVRLIDSSCRSSIRSGAW